MPHVRWPLLLARRYTRAAVKAVQDGAAAGEGAAAQENMLVVMGEKGRSQLQRDMRNSIFSTIAGGCTVVGRGAQGLNVLRARPLSNGSSFSTALASLEEPAVCPRVKTRLQLFMCVPLARSSRLHRVPMNQPRPPMLQTPPRCG